MADYRASTFDTEFDIDFVAPRVPGIDAELEAAADENRAPGLLVERRVFSRARKICEEYLEGSLVTLPRITIAGGFHHCQRLRVVAPGSVGLVICHNIERSVPSWADIFAEMDRILAPGGIAYIAAPDKGALFDPIYGLPFLSQLPNALSKLYLILALRGEQPLLRSLAPEDVRELNRRFRATEYTRCPIAGAPDPTPGLLEFSLVKSF